MEKLLRQYVERLKKAYGPSLRSVILYGSGATPEDYDEDYSDINILCVLEQITPAELTASGPVFAWWQTKRKPAPLLLSVNELAGATDCFAIEFRDMQRRRKVLYGEDVLDGLRVGEPFYRLQVEYELRTKLLRLRQKAAGAMASDRLARELLVDSVSTFCLLARHVLLVHGWAAPRTRRDVISEAAARMGIDAQPFLKLLDVREKKIKPSAIKAAELVGPYLKQIEKLIDGVDALGAPRTSGAGGEI